MIDMTYKQLSESESIDIDGFEFVKVVRCKDCKWWINGMCYSDNFILRFEEVKPDWFCADGKRKEQDDGNNVRE